MKLRRLLTSAAAVAVLASVGCAGMRHGCCHRNNNCGSTSGAPCCPEPTPCASPAPCGGPPAPIMTPAPAPPPGTSFFAQPPSCAIPQ